MRYIFLFFTTTLFAFCNNVNDKTTNIDSLEKQGTNHPADEATLINPAKEGIEGCYMMILKRDTMVLHIESSEKITGKLTFDNFEKDGSSGLVNGAKNGDTLKLSYAFASEGMNTVMDVYFKVDGDKLLRGVGDMQTKGDTAYFTNPSQVKFPEENPFVKTICHQIPAKYRL